jgi:hypothetical protein
MTLGSPGLFPHNTPPRATFTRFYVGAALLALVVIPKRTDQVR